MHWKPLLLAVLLCFDLSLARPGVQPLTIDAQSTPAPADSTPTTTTAEKLISSTIPPVASRRANSKEILRRIPLGHNITSLAATTTTTTTTERYDDDSDTIHMGVAVPMAPEEVELEAGKDVVKSTTPNDGLSTWILLSGGGSSSTPPTTTSTTKSPARLRYDDKVEKKPQFRLRTTPTTTTTTTTTTTAKPKMVVQEKSIVKATITKVSNPMESVNKASQATPQLIRKKTKRPAVAAAPTTTTTTTTTTEAPLEIEPEPTTTATIESTTFLIMEPKDADFDLPQDRSPGPTTKKPKRKTAATKLQKTKKTKVTAVAKKPTKAPKEKPFTTQIYNYLAREVMPTVGVGLVGLTVAAGLATYFLGPFGALRRSYDNAADRKDDMYYHNNEEYGGNNGQSEEEVFGKVIAGMPVNSPYRNSIKYGMYRPRPQPQPQNVRVVQGPPPQHYRVRGNSYQHQTQPQPQPGPGMYMNTKRNDDRTQIYRYNSEPNANVQYQRVDAASVPTYGTSNSDPSAPPSSIAATISITSAAPSLLSQDSSLEIVTPQTIIEPTPGNHNFAATDDFAENSNSNEQFNPMETNILKKRSKFVVGATDGASFIQEPISNEMVPEHGPRRRRRDLLDNVEFENEIDGVLKEEKETTTVAPLPTPMVKTEKESNILSLTSTTAILESTTAKMETGSNSTSTEFEVKPDRTNVFDLLRGIFEVKLRMGLSFLQQTTSNFQRYLTQVEKRVENSNVFRSRYPNANSKKQ